MVAPGRRARPGSRTYTRLPYLSAALGELLDAYEQAFVHFAGRGRRLGVRQRERWGVAMAMTLLRGYVIPIKITVAALVSVVAIGLIGAYVFCTDATPKEQLEFCAAVLGGAAVVYAGYYAGASLQVSVRQARKDNAFNILHGFNEVDMAKTRRLIEKKTGRQNRDFTG